MPDPSTTSASRAERVQAEPVAGPREPVRLDFAFMRARLSRWVALGFGAGLSPTAPGTVGTLWAWAAFLVLDPWLSTAAWWGLLVAGFALGCMACERTGRDLGVPDHSGMVWDEIIAFWLVLVMVPAGLASQFAAFVVFRFFDVVKPPPIRFVDRTVKGGFGVMLDDLIAAFFTLLACSLWMAWRS